MKHSTIEQLWTGVIKPAEDCGVGIPEIENLVVLIERNKEELRRKLGQEQWDVFEKYTDCAEEYSYLVSLRAFSDGFCLAAKLMAEALRG